MLFADKNEYSFNSSKPTAIKARNPADPLHQPSY